MFTGLIEEVGVLAKVDPIGDGRKLTVQATTVMSDLKVNDSIAINGCCQTVIEVSPTTFSCISIEETLKKTTFGSFKTGDHVNLERPLLPSTRMGGHFVMGHVDCVGEVIRKEVLSTSWTFDVRFPEEFEKYIIRIGSISMDGTSLTVADLKKNVFTVAIIPHTMDKTVFPSYEVGSKVNLEFDMLGKYMEKLVTGKD
ncbi:MAG: riboflavin synthase [Bacteroidetes bacterium]|nr:riboflavin synthase [Bacteroidota bacterium]